LELLQLPVSTLKVNFQFCEVIILWRKIMRYAHLHEVNPDKYPAGRVPVEMSEFISDMKDFMAGFFGGDDSILGRMFIFFLNNPVLVFLIAFGLAYGSFNLLRYAFRVTKF